ncbi:MAG: sigma 54-interacting transcriptional regulator [Myxococcales bacterium]|nr:sigma 54-interacting transcriptional regulator [Myxococcales bacterium]
MPDSAKIYLQIVTRDRASTRALPDDGALTIGRGQQAAIRLDDKAVSRQHAELIVERRRVRIVDLGGRNGTRVNGKRLLRNGERPLASGDVISIGGATLVLHADEAEETQTVEAAQSVAPTRIELGERVVLIAAPVMARVFELIRRLAASELPVLIRGETGVGKEHAAYAVHHWSSRAAGPFVAVNCAAIPQTLVESELFGHVRGAFTGAAGAREGLFERAGGGTLFLDELGELPPATQAKLLRVLEDGLITPVGAARPREVDVRVVAATNRDLAVEVESGGFRRDLYFRLASAPVEIPPLRERVHEVPVLASAFLEQASARIGRAPPQFGPGAVRLLLGHPWPGNVRELRNLAEYLVAAIPGETIEARDIRERLRESAVIAGVGPQRESEPEQEPEGAPEPTPDERPPLAEELKALERARMIEALERAGGVQKHAAALIGMPLRTFSAKLKQYGLKKG